MLYRTGDYHERDVILPSGTSFDSLVNQVGTVEEYDKPGFYKVKFDIDGTPIEVYFRCRTDKPYLVGMKGLSNFEIHDSISQ